MSATSTPSVPSLALSSHEIATAAEHLAGTRDALLGAVMGLSDAQWHFRPEPEVWTISEILEHLVIIENRVHGIAARMPNADAAAPDRDSSEVEATIFAKVPDRSNRFKAPDLICPTGKCTPEESLARFLELRARTIELLTEAPCLRGHVVVHPVLGPWDGYQWILGASAHSARHTDQIRECKSSAGFPAARVNASDSLN